MYHQPNTTATPANNTPIHPLTLQQQQQHLHLSQQQNYNNNNNPTPTTNYPFQQPYPQQQQQQLQLSHNQLPFSHTPNVLPTTQTLPAMQNQLQQQQPIYMPTTQYLAQQPQQLQPLPQFAPGYLMNVGQGKPLSALPMELSTPVKKRDSPWSALSPRVPSGNARLNSPSNYSFGFGDEDNSRSRSPSTAEGGIVMEDAPPTESLYGSQSDSPKRDNTTGGMTGQQLSPMRILRSSMRYEAERSSSESVFEAASRASDGLTSPAVTESVIVYGFPSSATSYVLSQFRNYGDIVSYKTSPNGGNWMTITYSTRLAAQMALAKNGRIYGNVLMIGVLPAPQDNDDDIQHRIPADQNDVDSFAASRNVAVGSESDASTSIRGVRAQTARVVQNASIFKTSTRQSRGMPVEGETRGAIGMNRDTSKSTLASSGMYQKISDALWGW